MKKSENGFGIVGVLLAILVIGVLIGAGYFVYQAQPDKQTKKSTEQKVKKPLVQFTDQTNLYSISHPADWSVEDKGSSEFSYGGVAYKTSNAFVSYPGDSDSDVVVISSDKTPAQAQQITSAWTAAASDEPFETITTNAYKTLHRHTESEALGREDLYLIVNKDQSSVYFSITLKMSAPHEDFIAMVNSIKFLQ